MIDPIEFIKYDKISDDVYVLGPNVILRFTVSLSKITQEGKRYHFYKEFEYESRTIDKQSLITVKRSYDYYLSLENVQKSRGSDEKLFIRIGLQDYCKFKEQIDTAVSWFRDKKYKNLYAKTKGKLILMNPVPESIMGGYPQNKFLRFIPTIIDKGEGKDRLEPGVELDLSSYDNYITMDINRLMGLQYIISTFNMYASAQTMVNALGFPDGMNRFSMHNSTGKVIRVEEFDGHTTSVMDRIFDKKNISSLE